MGEQRFALGPFTLDRSGLGLLRDGKAIEVGRRGIELIKALVAASGQIVTKAELLDRAWPDVTVEEGNLAVQIAALRRAMGKRSDGEDWIETVPRVGYRIVVDAVAERLPSLVVLPFANLSGDPEQEYFADGMVDDITTALSRFHFFAVVARSSAFTFKGRTIDVRQVARELDVRYVLEGSIRKAGERLRVTAELADGETGIKLWGETFEGFTAGMFDVQDSITEAVLHLVEPQIRKAEIERARRKRPDSLNAHDLYWRGLAKMHRLGTTALEDYSEAIDLFEKAVALDDGFAPALVYAAWAHEKRLIRGGIAPAGIDDASAAIALARRAVELDQDDGIVLAIAGLVLVTVAGVADGGMVRIRRALSFNPNSLLVANVAGYAYFHGSEFDRSISCYEQAMRLSPVLPDIGWSTNGIARAHLSAGRFDEALVWCERALEIGRDYDFSHCMAAACLVHLGRRDAAMGAVKTVRSLWPELTISKLIGRDGDTEGRDRFLAEGLRQVGLPEA